MLDISLAESRILYFWEVLESINKFIIEINVLQCLFVRKSNEKQRKGRVISSFTKRETFSSLMTTKCSWDNLTMYSSLLALSFSVWLRRERTWTLNWKESLLIFFENCQEVPYSHRHSKNEMMNTFIIVR